MTIRTLINRGTFIGDPSADTPYAGALKLNALVSKTYVATAAQFGGVTKEATYTNTIAAAVADGVPRVLIPEKYDLDNSAGLPYNASLVTFNPAVQMLREGGNPAWFDLKAYGGDPTATDITNTAALQAAFNAAPIGGTVYVPTGTYNHLAFTWSRRVNLIGAGNAGSVLIYTPVTATTAWTVNAPADNLSGPSFGFYDVQLNALATVNPPTGISINTNFFTMQNCAMTLWGTTAITFGGAAQIASFINFYRVYVFACKQGLLYPNLGGAENIFLQHCTFNNLTTITNGVQNQGGNLYFHNCSFDNAQLALSAGVTNCVGCHFEAPGGAISVPLIAQTGGILSIFGGEVVVASDATATTAISASDAADAISARLTIEGMHASSGIAIPFVTVSGNLQAKIEATIRGSFTKLVSGTAGPVSYEGRFGSTTQILRSRTIATLTDAATIAVDASLAEVQQVTLTASGHTMGTPTSPQFGQPLKFIIIQDGTGGRTLLWAAVFKVTWSDTGNTPNKSSTISFVYDGAAWKQDGAQSPYV